MPLIEHLKKAVSVPIVADIHFDYRLALEAVAAGVDKVRINPGNIGDEDRVRQVVQCCKLHNVPIRVGVNSGSPHPCGGQLRQLGKAHPGKVRPPHRAGDGGQCAVPRLAD